MYKDLLELSYTDVRQKYPKFESINSVRKVITFKNDETLDSYSAKSDVIVYFDVLSDSTPLVLIERIRIKEVSMRKLKVTVKEFNKEHNDYVAHSEVSSCKQFVDIVVVSRTIHDNIMRVDG